MVDSARLVQLLECLIHVIGRVAIPVEKVQEIVETGSKQVQAFNLCDGTKGQSQIARTAGLNQGNLSRSAARWVEHGVAFWVGEGADARLLHVYPIPTKASRKAEKNRQVASK